MAVLSDEEMFGLPPAEQAPQRRVLSDQEMFGTQPRAPLPAQPLVPSPTGVYSDKDMFGTEVDPSAGAYPGVEENKRAALGMGGWLKEGIRAFGQGAAGAAGAYLQGKAGDAGKPVMLPGESDLEYQLRLEEWRSAPPALPVAQNPLYKAGSTISNAEIFKRPKGYEDHLGLDVASGAGSLGTMLATAPLGPAFGAEFAIGMGRGEAVERAIKAGATEEQIRRAGDLATAAGATDLADLLLMQTGSAGRVMGLVHRVGSKALKGAFIEGGQEGLQQFIQNLVAKGVYKPDQDLLEDVPRNMLVGAIIGGPAKLMLDRGGTASEEMPTPEEINQVFHGGPTAPPVEPSSPLKITVTPGMRGEAPPDAPTDVSSRLRLPPSAPVATTPEVQPPEGASGGGPSPIERVLGTPSEAQEAPRTPDQVSDADAIELLRTWVGDRQGKRSDLGTLTDATIDNKAANLPQWIELARRQIIIQNSQASSPTAPRAVATPLPIEAPPRNEIPSNVVDFLSRRQGKLKLPDPNAPMAEEITARPGVDLNRLVPMLGPQLYGDLGELPKITIKEMVQNSYDALKSLIAKGEMQEGNIHINADQTARTVQIYDNGSGMSPEILATKFLEIAGTHKEGGRASGGFGIAKMAFLFGNKTLDVRTMQNGKVAHLTATGPQLFEAMQDPSRRPKIQIREPTAEERKLFKDGHGTAIQVTIPESFTDSSGNEKKIRFPWGVPDLPTLGKSPLFDNINISYNGMLLDGSESSRPGIGKYFPINDFTPFANVNFNWGTVRVYVSNDQHDPGYGGNAHVLSNGLWQFSFNIKKNPNESYGDNVKREFYVDVSPKVRPEDGGYPFQLNRQGFTQIADKDFGKIANYISVLYHHEELSEGASSFGNAFYLQQNPETGEIERVHTKIEPDKAQTETPLAFLKAGNKVTVQDGKLVVNGRPVPELTPEMLKTMRPDSNELIVDQSKIDPNRPMVHDNTLVNISSLEKKSVVQLGGEKFGRRFDEFILDLGNAFKTLRDVVSDMTMPKREIDTDPIQQEIALRVRDLSDYTALKKEAVGISFDLDYRGVSIRAPFSGSFINPAVPEFNDPLRGAVGMVYTMVHELAHHKVRSHNADFPAEMQRILIHLDTHPTFDFSGFKQEVVNVIAQNQDIFEYINGLYSGAYNLEARGKRFEDSGSYESGDGSGSLPSPDAFTERARSGVISVGAGRGGAAPTGSPRRPQPRLRITEERTVVDPLRRTEQYTNALRAESGDSEVESVPAQPEIEPLYQAVQRAHRGGPGGGANIPPAVAALPAHAARMNWLMKWAFGIERVTDKNLHVEPVVRYSERVRDMRLDVNQILDAATRIAKSWRGLGGQKENLAAFINDVANMNYRTPAEVTAGTARHPTAAEVQTLIAKHKLSSEAFGVFKRQRDFFHIFLDQVRADAIERAKRNLATQPTKLINKTNEINAQFTQILAKPYFPFTRFGRHFIQVKNAAGDVLFFQTYERRGLQSAVAVQQAEFKKLNKAKLPGEKVTFGVLPETAVPFIGLPSELLEGIETQLSLTGGQRDAMRMLRMEISPATRFAHRFKSRDYTPGYSDDALRAFSRFAFHGARYYGRTKYKWALEGAITDLKRMALVGNDNKLGAVADYMEDHLKNTVMDTRGDFGLLKGAIFLWTFGYSVAGATLNLSQMIVTHHFLASRFGGTGLGDIRSQAALVKAMTNVKNFYKRGEYAKMTHFEGRAFDYAIKTGRITESQAAELAGLAQGEGLLGLGNSQVARGFQKIMEKGTWLFETAEQINRRVTFRAALDLAKKHPNSKAEREAIVKYADELRDLINGSYNGATGTMNPSEAKAVITAIHVVEQTQFVYAKENRARFMRGPVLGTIFVFKTFLIQMLQLLGNNKATMLPRMLLTLFALGGLMGLPGAEDAEDIANLVGKQLYGKDFKLQLWIRQMLRDMGQGEYSEVALHGLARKGFGVPAVLDMMGISSAPVLDRSKAVGMGRILPFELGKLVDPGKDVNRAISEQTQRASGAVFSVGFNLYKALQDVQAGASMGDIKTWEKAMPRAASSVTRAMRAYSEGRERGRGGPNSAPTIVPYDIRDTEQMAEIIALAAGYMPLRQALKWDVVMAEAEVKSKVTFEREIIMKQRFEALMGKDSREIESTRQAIVQFNKELPSHLRGYAITGESHDASMEGRLRAKQARDADIPVQLRDKPIKDYIRSLFPDAVDARRVR
jgi:hypothetical protein